MGTKMAPAYATLVMGLLENRLYKLFGDLYGHTDEELLSKLFERFLDVFSCGIDLNNS